MGYEFVISPCISCGRSICCNADHVPSLMVDGVREPLCPECADKWNRIHRTSKGLDPVPIHPDAYSPREVPY